MINQAYKYLGQTWISGAASSPQYGVDCSGLVTQALYASGINPAPVSAIQHAQVGNEWNSRMLWSDNRMPKVDFNNRQRGDLIFYTDPSTGLIWHVGILLNRDTMIESWPYAVQVHSIYSGRGNIAGVKRVFA
ncbi:C40 family peptidase [Companilactobacillus paralimentarius]|nr:NlpC/P60 family protein [Companilactobacillus paralimentarius]